MTGPHVVDLRGPDGDDREDDPPTAEATGAKWLAGVALLVVGGLIGWLIALPAGQPDPEVAQPAPTTIASPVPTATPADAGAVARDALLDDPGVPLEPRRERLAEAGLQPLVGVAALEGPITLVSGFVGTDGIRLSPDGRVALVAAATGFSPPPSPGAFAGYPVGEVDAGVLFVPTDYALGAIAYWTAEGGVTLPIPEAPYDTSFLAAAEALGVFLSAGDIVVRDLERAENLLRIDGSIEGEPVVHACLSPDGDAVALVADTGSVVVVDVATGTVASRLDTSTSRFGIAWTSGGQLARLVTEDDVALVVATDLATGIDHEVARLDDGAGWKLTTAGTGC